MDSTDITIAGSSSGSPLKFQKLSTGVLVESDTSATLTLRDLRIEGTTEYGIYVGAAADEAKVNTVTIENCHVQGAYGQHGFRLYANHVDVRNCTSCLQRASGLWAVQGKNITVENFQTDKYVRIGPNHECVGGGGPEKGERVIGANITGINAEYIEVQSGVIGCWLNDLTMQISGGHGLRISRTPGGNAVSRTTNRIRWAAGGLHGNTSVGIDTSSCNGADISPCVGDVDNNNTVDVDDLIAVILSWGPCHPTTAGLAPVGACWFENICHPHWTQSACQTAGGVYKGDGTDCWTHPAMAPCCTISTNLCEPDVLPAACWGSNKKYLGNLTSCSGVNCSTAISTMPACSAGCLFAQFPCQADIMPAAYGNWIVDVDDLIQVILGWGCSDSSGARTAPKAVTDCESQCAQYDPTYGENYRQCMESCIEQAQQQGQIDP